jgi:SAM-dependent methyltransferase
MRLQSRILVQRVIPFPRLPVDMSATASTHDVPAPTATLHWHEGGADCLALWRSERGAAPPSRVVVADDTMNADTAYRLACGGTALLWRGDFQNARQLLQAMARRADQTSTRKDKKAAKAAAVPVPVAQAFHLHRQAQAQRARILGMLLLPFEADYGIPLRRAPDVKQACAEAWGAPASGGVPSVASLRELLGLISAHEWRKKGVEVAALGGAPDNRIHPHYGVFSPLRGDYVALVADAAADARAAGRPARLAFDIGTGSGVLAAVLARRGIARVVATDQDPRALACARENIKRLGHGRQVEVVAADLFPPGRADIVVCNPPWLPARAAAPIEQAVYDPDSRMLLGFLNGLAEHLAPGGEGWLVLSDFAEHLGLRTRAELLAAIASAGLVVVERIDTRPQHSKASDVTDPLHAARAAEVTSLWRLAAA